VHPCCCSIFCLAVLRVVSNDLFSHQKFYLCWLSGALVELLCFLVAGPPLPPPGLPSLLFLLPPFLPLVQLPPAPTTHAPVCFWAGDVLVCGVDQAGIGFLMLIGQPEFS